VSLLPVRPALQQIEYTTAYTAATDTPLVPELASFGAGFVPGVGQAQAIDQAATGRDRITGDTIGTGMRVFIAATILVPPLSKTVRAVAPEAAKVAREVEKFAPEAEKLVKEAEEEVEAAAVTTGRHSSKLTRRSKVRSLFITQSSGRLRADIPM